MRKDKFTFYIYHSHKKIVDRRNSETQNSHSKFLFTTGPSIFCIVRW
jgi:hypothetical protein